MLETRRLSIGTHCIWSQGCFPISACSFCFFYYSNCCRFKKGVCKFLKRVRGHPFMMSTRKSMFLTPSPCSHKTAQIQTVKKANSLLKKKTGRRQQSLIFLVDVHLELSPINMSLTPSPSCGRHKWTAP